MRKLKNEELDRLTTKEFKLADKLPVTILLDNIRSLNNVGSAFRTSDAFLVEKIWLCGITGKPPHRDIHKTALGATDSVNWEHHVSSAEVIGQLRSKGVRIVALEHTNQSFPLQDFHPTIGQQICFVFGNEVAGISEPVLDLADDLVEIPQYGTKHSLNVSVSVGVVLWHYLYRSKYVL